MTCNKTETSKWYSGPICRQCYRKTLYKNEDQKNLSHQKCKIWREKNKEYIKEKYNEWKSLNRESYLTYSKNYREKNKESILVEKKQYHIDNYIGDSHYRLSRVLRSRIKMALRENYKTGSAISLLGCSINDCKKHIESQFESWMTWENYGNFSYNRDTWHIDHIKPFALFDLSDPIQQQEVCNYKNLQPMLAKNNLIKGKKYE